MTILWFLFGLVAIQPKPNPPVLEQPRVVMEPAKIEIAQWPQKIGASKEEQELIDYARTLTQNLDFIFTIERESWRYWQAVWDWWTSYWLCQRHQPGRYERWVNNEDTTIADWYAMIDACRKTWQIKEKTTWVGSWLHAYSVRHTVKNRFII